MHENRESWLLQTSSFFSESMKREGSISQQNKVNRVFKLSSVSSSKTQSLFTFAIVILATFTHHLQIS